MAYTNPQPETTCCVCGRDIHDTTPLTGKRAVQHRRFQEHDGFKRGNAIVHYTQREREQATAEFVARMELTPQTGVNPAKVAQQQRWTAFVEKMTAKHPAQAWRVLCARDNWNEGKPARAIAYSLKEFRHAVYAARTTQTTANTLETAPVVRSGHCDAARWKTFEDKMYSNHHGHAWLVLCARLEVEEGKRKAAAKTLRMFRHFVFEEAQARQAARIDWLDAADTRRWAA